MVTPPFQVTQEIVEWIIEFCCSGENIKQRWCERFPKKRFPGGDGACSLSTWHRIVEATQKQTKCSVSEYAWCRIVAAL
jgi:hypothetical protein